MSRCEVALGHGAPFTGVSQAKLWVDTDTGNLWFRDFDCTWILISTGGGTVAECTDGDKGDVIVSGNCSIWTIDVNAVTYSKMQDVSTTNRLLGRVSAGAGDPEEVTPAQARTMLNVEDGADVTDATNVDAAGAVMNSDTSTSAMQFVIDEDSMTSDSDTKVPTQQSVKAYVDSAIGGGLADGDKGDVTVSAAGTVWTIDQDVVTYAKLQNVTNNNLILGRITAGAGNVEELTPTQIRTIINVEDGADVTDATNVEAAGAVMVADASVAGFQFVVDEDDMASNSATLVPTQQSVKAYVDANTGGGTTRKQNSDVLAFAANLAVDFDAGSYDNKITVATGNLSAPTFTATRLSAYLFMFTQDGTGNRTVTWPGNVKWKGGEEQPSVVAGDTSAFFMIYDGTDFLTTRIA